MCLCTKWHFGAGGFTRSKTEQPLTFPTPTPSTMLLHARPSPPRLSKKTHSSPPSLFFRPILPWLPFSPRTIRSSTTSLTRVFKRPKLPYRPGQVPHSVLRRSTHSTKTMVNPSPPQEDQEQQAQQHIDRTLDPRWKQARWQDISVGDFVLLQNNDAVPADIVVLSTSEPDGLCYMWKLKIWTANPI